MKAIWYTETGEAKNVLNYGEMNAPIPTIGEVLVRLHASGIIRPMLKPVRVREARLLLIKLFRIQMVPVSSKPLEKMLI
jgi:NADPH:quinone reductase-like Zn-dependent oxidoreductase